MALRVRVTRPSYLAARHAPEGLSYELAPGPGRRYRCQRRAVRLLRQRRERLTVTSSTFSGSALAGRGRKSR
jgi:hypothetical protein